MKATMITLSALILGGIAMTRAEATVLKVKADEPTYLYGGQASSVEGDIHRQNGDFFPWRGSGRLTWEVQVDQPGEYEVSLCHAAEPDAIGQQLQISSGQSRLSYTLAMTQGVFGKKRTYWRPSRVRCTLPREPTPSPLASKGRRQRWPCSLFAAWN